MGGISLAVLAHWLTIGQAFQAVVAAALALGVDLVGYGGGAEALAIDALGRALHPSYARRVALHEGGHFLVAYLLGLLPAGYALSSWDAYRRCACGLGGGGKLSGREPARAREQQAALAAESPPALLLPLERRTAWPREGPSSSF